MPFVGWKLGQFLGITDAGQVAVLLPVLHLLQHFGAVGGLAARQLLGSQGQVGAQRVAGLSPQAGLCRVIELGGVLALPRGGQRRGPGGVVMQVAVAGRLGGETFGRLAQRRKGLTGPALKQQGLA